MLAKEKTGVVIPCYMVSEQICDLIGKIGDEVWMIVALRKVVLL